MSAKKYDDGKSRMDLIPLDTIENVGKILGMGAQKYGENNWQELPNFWNRYKAALLRHLAAIDRGELYDQESKLPHIDHLSWGFSHGKGISVPIKDLDNEQDKTAA